MITYFIYPRSILRWWDGRTLCVLNEYGRVQIFSKNAFIDDVVDEYFKADDMFKFGVQTT